jgi:hypothetical protein
MATVKAPTFTKPKALKGLPGLGRKHKQQPLPDLDSGPLRMESLVDNELANLTRALGGDERLAKRLLKLKKKYFNTISGTIIELIVMDFLDRRGLKYEYQMAIFGGRSRRFGQVVDFAVDMGNRVIVIEPQGEYFHTRPGKIVWDAAQRLALLATTIWGKKVVLVEIWENRLLDKHKRGPALEAALNGIELGR